MSPEHAKLLLPYEEYRIWWAEYIRRPELDAPVPGVIDLEDAEVG